MEGRYTYGFRYDTPLAAYLSGRWQTLCISTNHYVWKSSDVGWFLKAQRPEVGLWLLHGATSVRNCRNTHESVPTPRYTPDSQVPSALGVEHSPCSLGWMATAELTRELIALFLPGLTFGRQSVRVLVPEVPWPGVRGSFYNTEHGLDFFKRSLSRVGWSEFYVLWLPLGGAEPGNL